jgi:hypothetical protein
MNYKIFVLILYLLLFRDFSFQTDVVLLEMEDRMTNDDTKTNINGNGDNRRETRELRPWMKKGKVYCNILFPDRAPLQQNNIGGINYTLQKGKYFFLSDD